MKVDDAVRISLIGVLCFVVVFGLFTLATFRGEAQPTAAIPFATSVTVTTTAAQLIGANPTRRALTICTPGNTNVVAIAPAPITPVQPGGPGVIITGTATASTCFTTTSAVTGVGAAWNAIASASTVVLVLEY